MRTSFHGGRRLLLLGLGAWILLPLQAAGPKPGEPQPIQVVVTPAKIEQRTFDPRNPPPEMPRLVPPESAVCVYHYACEVACGAESERALFKLKPAKITSITIRVGMDVTIWLPTDTTAKLADHESAHQTICEEVYREGGAVARDLAGRLIGYTLKTSLKDGPAARAEIEQLQKEVVAAYLGRTSAPCGRMQQYFDSITKHGVSDLGEAEAIARALAQEPGFARAGPAKN